MPAPTGYWPRLGYPDGALPALHLTLTQWLLGAIAAVFIGFSKTGMPGAGILVVPLLAEALGGRQSVGTMLPMLVTADLFAVAWYRRDDQWDRLVKLIPWVGLGMLLGAAVLQITGTMKAGKDWLDPLIGILVLAMLVVHLLRSRFGEKLTPHSRAAVAAVGTSAGFTTTASNAAGPIMAIYLQAMEMPKAQFMGTTAWFFFLVNAAKLPVFVALSVANPGNPIISPKTLTIDGALVPFILLGALAGRLLLNRIPQKLFDSLVLVLAAAAALRLVLR